MTGPDRPLSVEGTEEQSNVFAVDPAKPPTNQRELRSFLGTCNVYCTFFKGFAKLVAPLNLMTGKNESFEF